MNKNVFTLIEIITERKILTVFGFYISLTFQFHSDMVSIEDQITELINWNNEFQSVIIKSITLFE